MPEVVVLGSGTSNGVPMLGVDYPAEYLANPKNHRCRAAIAILGRTGNLLVDCPPELRIQMTRENIRRVEAVLITHTHADHVMGMDDLRSLCIVQKQAMPVYTLPRYQEDIRRIYPYAFQEFPPGIEVPRFDLHDAPDRISVGGMDIELFVVMHGKIPVIALRCETFAYVTDVSFIPIEVEEKLQGLETLILDAVRFKPHPNHYNLEQALEAAKRLGAKQTYLTHLSHDYDHDRSNAELPTGVALAYDGLRILI